MRYTHEEIGDAEDRVVVAERHAAGDDVSNYCDLTRAWSVDASRKWESAFRFPYVPTMRPLLFM